jgi:mono/diheme cytochrome c family protein
MKVAIRALLVLVIVGVGVGAWSAYSIVSRGLSTRVPPSAIEERMALTMRALATPRAVRSMKNPVDATPAVFDEGLAHFADHCASCHANDGSGSTEMGRSFYPPVPDMRAARTQTLSDGELFSIIENGIRLTGMPAWGTGTPDGEHGSWGLVHFIRRLPTLTPDDVARMEELNPRSPEQFRAAEEARRFLEGGSPETQPATSASHDQHK